MRSLFFTVLLLLVSNVVFATDAAILVSTSKPQSAQEIAPSDIIQQVLKETSVEADLYRDGDIGY